MCLSTVYKLVEGKDDPEEVCSHVSTAQADGDTVTFTDIMGTETKLVGTISSVDLVGNKIYVACAS
jgi:predicted RNA-binding protein